MANHHIQHHDILNKYPNKRITGNRYNYLILYCCVECYYFVNAVILRGRSIYDNYIVVANPWQKHCFLGRKASKKSRKFQFWSCSPSPFRNLLSVDLGGPPEDIYSCLFVIIWLFIPISPSIQKKKQFLTEKCIFISE